MIYIIFIFITPLGKVPSTVGEDSVILKEITHTKLELFHLAYKNVVMACSDYSLYKDKRSKTNIPAKCFPQDNRGTGVYKYTAYFSLYLKTSSLQLDCYVRWFLRCLYIFI